MHAIVPELLELRADRDLVVVEKTDGAQLIDIYYPQAPNGRCILYVHGGGWRGGDKIEEVGAPAIIALLKRGFFVAAANYRVAPQYQFPAHLDDIREALRFLIRNSKKYGFDPAQIGALGVSAGGTLVSLLGLMPSSDTLPAAVAEIYGGVDLVRRFRDVDPEFPAAVFGGVPSLQLAISRASPLNFVHSGAPPFLIVHGDADAVIPVESCPIFQKALLAKGVSAELLIVEGAPHYFSLDRVLTNGRRLCDAIADFFEKHLCS